MRICFAPMEGVTDAIFRRAHHDLFTGVHKYYIPFVSPTQNMFFTPRDLSHIAPENNQGIPAIPQIMAKNAEYFLWAAGILRDMGYSEVNLNLGCPSGTVTAKNKGSGLLRQLDILRPFLDEIYKKTPIPISIKTRIGFESPEEWPALLQMFSEYPVYELIIHPRTRTQFYKGTPYREAYAPAFEKMRCPLIYNGDLTTEEDCRALMAEYPNTSALMLGRGLVANPALARQMDGGPKLALSEIVAFHDRLWREYLERYHASFAIGRMRNVMLHLTCCFESPEKAFKAIRKSTTAPAYLDAVRRLFENHALLEHPHYFPL